MIAPVSSMSPLLAAACTSCCLALLLGFMANPRLQIQSGQHSGKLPGTRCQILSRVVYACPCKTFQVCPSITFLSAGVWLEERHNKRPLCRSTSLCCLSSNGTGKNFFTPVELQANAIIGEVRLDSYKQQHWNVLQFCDGFMHVNIKCHIDVYRIQVLGDECPTLIGRAEEIALHQAELLVKA